MLDNITIVAAASLLCCGLLSTSHTTARAFATPASAPINCKGCKATRLDDNGTLSDTIDGVQIISSGEGLEINATLITQNGSCKPVQTSAGIECGPDANCVFRGSYRVIVDASVGALRDDAEVCAWATVADPFGARVLNSSTDDWIAACDGLQKWDSVRFFEGATDCSTGSILGELKFTGICGVCPANGVVVVEPDVQIIDIACVGAGGAITLTEQDQPWSGQQFRATAQGLDDNGLVICVIGSNFTSVPLDLIDGIGLTTCTLFVAPEILVPMIPAGGVAELAVVLPSDDAAVGANLYVQFAQYTFDANGVADELSSSNALNLTIGHEYQ